MQKITQTKFVYFTLIATLFSLNIFAQKPMEKRSFEVSLEKDEAIQTEIKNNQRINIKTGKPVALYGLSYQVPQGTPESMAQYYLEHQSEKLGIPKSEIQNLQHHATRTTNAGSVVRYRQHINGIPVNRAEVTISISPQNKVVMVLNSFQQIKNINTQPVVTATQAYQLAHNYLNITSNIMHTANKLMVYSNSKMARLAHEVVISSDSPRGEWHVFVDARTQEVFKVVDMNHYYGDKKEHIHDANCKHNKPVNYGPFTNEEVRRRATGTAMVFNPDPLSSNTVAYGGGYVDGADADTAQLTAARFSVTLNDITQTGSTYSLVGPRAEIVDFDTPNTGLFTQNSSDFSFTRNEQGFEPANTYYHIDFLMNYINNTLGCNVMPYQYAGGVKFDPHGAGGADNSYYTSGSGQLAFGEGCVDDAEDSDVIHHELGHGLHDWVTAGGLSQVDGLSEGSGDYVAQSYNRSLGNWAPGDPAYNWVFNWDGHNVCWNGRITNYTAAYPGGLVGQIHADGQIWASCLMTVWDVIGQQEMDKIFYEGLGMTNGTSSQNDAANAVYQAALNLSYTNTQINAIHSGLTACGYTLPSLPGPPVAAFSADNETICLDTNNMVTFTDDTVPTATSWAWTFEGGSPATSTAQNPTVTYAADGTYDVTLVATNSFGSDTSTVTDYISVVSGAACPSCTVYASPENLSIAIPDGPGGNGNPGAPAEHIINIPSSTMIDYITVNVDISHTYINDLIVEIKHPDGITATSVFNRECGSEDNINVSFIDGMAAFNCAATTGNYNPSSPLSVFSGLDTAGDWTISVTDNWDAITGTINDWSIEICSVPTASVEEFAFDAFSIFPNPNNGEFTIKLNSSSNEDVNVLVYDSRGRKVYNNAFINTADFSEVINLNSVQSGMYFVKVNDGERETIKKLLIN